MPGPDARPEIKISANGTSRTAERQRDFRPEHDRTVNERILRDIQRIPTETGRWTRPRD